MSAPRETALKQNWDKMVQTMANLEEQLEIAKTNSEKIEAVEKQLAHIKQFHEERGKLQIYGDGSMVHRDVFDFSESMTKAQVKKSLDRALYTRTEDPYIKEVQEMSDSIKIHCELLGVQPHELKIYKDWEALINKSSLGKALSVVGSPASWVPEDWSEEIQTYYQQELRVATLFNTFPMAAGTVNWPFIGEGFSVKITGEPTAEPVPKVPSSDASQSTIILTAKTFGGRQLLSEELEEDAVTSFVPVLRTRIIPRGMAEADEDAIVNGDTGTHQDPGLVGGSDDVRRAWLGIRAIALDESATYDVTTGSTVFAYTDFAEVLKLHNKGMGVVPGEGAWVMSNKAYLDASVFDSVKENPQLVAQLVSPVVNGVVNIIHGRPVITSVKYPENLDSTGVVPATPGTVTGFTHVNRDQFVMGVRRGTTLDMVFDVEERVWKIIITQRKIFKQLLPTGNITCASGINV